MRRSRLFVFLIAILLLLPHFGIAETLGSSNYQIENPSLDYGGESSSSANYTSRDSFGDQNSDAVNSTNFKALAGFIWPAYPGVPAQPTFTNTGGTLYDSLDFIVATGDGQQSDTNYAIAISSDNFVTTNYIQTDDTVGSSPAWQTYVGWNSGTGERVTGLSPSTTYKIKVKARYGADSESGYSQEASASTSSPTLTLTFTGITSGTSVAGETTTVTTTSNAIAYGSLIISTPAVAAHKTTVTTNATGGYTTTLQQNQDLTSAASDTIAAISASNASPAAWPGGITNGRFGYHTTDSLLCTGTTSRFSSNDTYAGLTTTPEEVACSSGPVTAEDTTVVYKLEVGSLQAAGSYSNTLTYITSAKF